MLYRFFENFPACHFDKPNADASGFVTASILFDSDIEGEESMGTQGQCNSNKNSRHSRAGMYLPETLAAATRDVNELFDRLFEGPTRESSRADSSRTNARPNNSWAAAASVWEDDDHFHIALDLPGVAADDLDVTIDDGNLVVTALRKDADDRRYVHNERRFGEISRTITLPDTVDPDSIDAEYTSGVLVVTLSKRPEVLPRKVQVRAG